MKFTRKILPALALLLVSAVLMTTATFAWFSMNTVATATGMQADIEASDNVLIAAASADDKQQPDTAFKTSLDLALTDAYKLNPVSTVNGKDFFYVNTNRVNGGGGVDGADKFVAYDPAALTPFNDNYRTTGSVGYADYDFQIMATNSSDTAKSLVLNRLALTYGGSDTIQPSFRVAVFVKEFSGAAIDDATLTATDKVMIYAPTGAAYINNKAASSTSATAAAPTFNSNTTFSGAIAAGETKYFRVLVRVWLEGQDTKCTNKLFANLDKTWSLDAAFALGSASVTALGNTASTIAITDAYSIGTAAQDYAQVVAVDGVTYYPVLNGSNPVEVGTGTNVFLYTTQASGALVQGTTDFYTLTKDASYDFYSQPFDVTPQVVITAAGTP